jgi:hypothetical protein
MAYLTESEVLARASRVTQRVQKTASRVLTEDRASASDTFDVFLSHSSAEPEEILLGVKKILEDLGLKIYVDKYSDPQLSPDSVTAHTAEVLRGRMRQSHSLLYVYSRHSTKSRWMPWEIGFFDGHNGRIGVLPVTQNQEEAFKGEEYLHLYPYVDQVRDKQGNDALWINRAYNEYARLYQWIKGSEEIYKRS